jgi:hypothetical protein
MTRRKLTPKQRVLRKYPNAWSFHWKGAWTVYDGTSHDTPPFAGQEILGEAVSANIAWKLADMRIHL